MALEIVSIFHRTKEIVSFIFTNIRARFRSNRVTKTSTTVTQLATGPAARSTGFIRQIKATTTPATAREPRRWRQGVAAWWDVARAAAPTRAAARHTARRHQAVVTGLTTRRVVLEVARRARAGWAWLDTHFWFLLYVLLH